MRKLHVLCLLLVSASAFCQTTDKTLSFKQFGWTIKIPSGYAPNPEEQDATVDAQILFRHQKDPAHYIEAYSEPFDESIDGNYAKAALAARSEAVDVANQMMPESTTLEQSETTISGLKFIVFTTKLTADANFILYTTTFTRLFKNEALTINVYYAKADEGQRLIEAVKQSVFKK
ncbi:MAG: hypothetical protein EOO50_05460 [Flavobacterium sp.]|uniref:hypothetical protein n=1 Tax=Flavobacterium sp. TaxID=239 RepID=UPI0012122801|nr:hypothetical protein [Flavobacterium sp.]RZJ67436.1 MAG: hypothetical protein EOO50_05460 [Flavobacterium sp.]